MSPALDLQRLSKLYGRTAALKAVSLRLDPGEILALLGPNGSGKTTLLKIVAGAVAPTIGGGTIFGHDILTDQRELRTEVGFLSSETYLYEDLTARENLRFTATMAGMRLDDGTLNAALAEVEMDTHAQARVRTFSSGMRRRVALARVLLLRPRLFLLDEPYNSLDAGGADLLDGILRGYAAEGRAIILATHDADRASALAGSAAVLEQGSLVFTGSMQAYRVRRAQHVG